VIEVTLPEVATTGYVWEPEVDEQKLQLVGDERHAREHPRGAPGLRVITFRALEPQATELRVVKRRRWEADAKDAFTLTVDIAPVDG
jgi:predicted secreted protein